jgi:hypothetical protein
VRSFQNQQLTGGLVILNADDDVVDDVDERQDGGTGK